MNLQMIASLFTLFSGEEDQEKYLPLLMTAIHEVNAQLCSGADGSEVRLCYLAAAIANLRYTQIYGARDKALATYAGTVAYQTNGEQQLRFAMHLVQSYRALCRDLLKDGEFVFVGVRGH